MNKTAKEQQANCPVKIGDEYENGIVIFICGSPRGWDIYTKHEQIGTTNDLLRRHINRESHWYIPA